MDVPVIRIEAATEAEAKQELLANFNSDYGKFDADGWDAFTFDVSEEWLRETVTFDDFVGVEDVDWLAANDIGELGSPNDLDPGRLGQGADQVRVVLVVPKMMTLERAIKATKLKNRGDAVVAICESYLGADKEEDIFS